MSGDKYRKYLKECAEIVGLDINITTKTGRKTFINLMHQQGLDAEDIAQMVGHNNIKTTYKFYIKFSPKRITLSVQKAFGKEFLVG
jgi:site-specific recombinase XerD